MDKFVKAMDELHKDAQERETEHIRGLSAEQLKLEDARIFIEIQHLFYGGKFFGDGEGIGTDTMKKAQAEVRDESSIQIMEKHDSQPFV